MPKQNVLRIRISEIEHQGDLDPCIEKLCQSGATIIDSHIDADAEEAVVHAKVEDYADFRLRLEQTDIVDFCESMGWFKEDDHA
ncbi:MAG: hypothetical protein JJU29_23465 [Verrucomicrobia bacterium]|nr:hypothetical protein [Verrucomicrobiota bacterium]